MREIENCAGQALRDRLIDKELVTAVGVYDVFSASLVAREFDTIFCSGYGLSASFYGLPDMGIISYTDMFRWVDNIRSILPNTHIIVDMDDGYADINIAIAMIRKLERIGASGIIYEDQARPKSCGHIGSKKVVNLDLQISNIQTILDTREDIFVITRTDITNTNQAIKRVVEYSKLGVDGIMIESIKDINVIPQIKKLIEPDCKIIVNLIQGGKTKLMQHKEYSDLGVDMVIYSTPCLFSAQDAIVNMLQKLKKHKILPNTSTVTLQENHDLLNNNLG